MKKKILIGLLMLFSLSACGETKVQKEPEKKDICKEISSFISEYDKSSLTFKELKSSISSKYDEICKNDNSGACQFISTDLINNDDAMLGDNPGCSIYEDKEMFDNCVKNGENFEYLDSVIKSSQDTVVYGIKEKCGLVKTDE